MALCDQRIDGPNDPDCLRLAQEAADAANFAKSGFPVLLTEELRPQAYPDFMQTPEKESYRSQKVLGKGFVRLVYRRRDSKKRGKQEREETPSARRAKSR
jgi:hypothetical protein